MYLDIKKKNHCIYLTSFRVSKAHFNIFFFSICFLFELGSDKSRPLHRVPLFPPPPGLAVPGSKCSWKENTCAHVCLDFTGLGSTVPPGNKTAMQRAISEGVRMIYG